MTIQTSREAHAWTRKVKALAVGFLLAALITAATALPAHAFTTFVVTETGDLPDASTGDDRCDTETLQTGDQCTLRAAIQQADATAGADAINFAIPGTGVHTISPQSPLPAITEQVTIDGYTQPGAHPNTKAAGNDAVLRIVLSGTNAGSSGFETVSGSSNNLIRGLVINRFTGVAGINIHGTSSGNIVEGNFIGTDVTGTRDRGNEGDGVSVSFGSDDVVIGGTTPASRNVISGNDERGVEIRDATFTRVLGNRIGTTPDGKGALGNGLGGVSISGANHEVGDGTAAGANTIAFNGRDGVTVANQGVRNKISRNSIFSNVGLGIDLLGPGETDTTDFATPNDPLDVDTGADDLQNTPVISSAKTSSTKTTITGKLASRPDGSYTVEFFSNLSGNEGKKYLGEKVVNTDASGNATFTFSPTTKVPAGQTVTATACSITLDAAFGDTSEFSAPRKVASS